MFCHCKELNAKIDLLILAVESLIKQDQVLTRRLTMTSATLSDAINTLAADVAAEQTVEQSAITLLNSIPQLIKDAVAAAQAAGATPAQLAALDALATSIEGNTPLLAKAVTDNTPAAPPPTDPAG